MKHDKAKEHHGKANKIILIVLIIIFLLSICYIIYNVYINYRDRKQNDELESSISSNINNEEEILDESNGIMEKVIELKETNDDIKGWIKIEDTNINYPLLQGTDNNYYLKRNYKKEVSNYGSIFIDKDSNLEDVNSNVIIYGHTMKDKEMFQNLLNYKEKEYYEKHNTIKIVTDKEVMEYQIAIVFKSRIFYENEKNAFRYYYCTDLSTEEKYNDYIENCKKLQLYDTGIDAKYGEQLITLIACEYSQENGRMVIVAKKI